MDMGVLLRGCQIGELVPKIDFRARAIDECGVVSRAIGSDYGSPILAEGAGEYHVVIRVIREIKELDRCTVLNGGDFIIGGGIDGEIDGFRILVDGVTDGREGEDLGLLSELEIHGVGDGVAVLIDKGVVGDFSFFISRAADQHAAGSIANGGGAPGRRERGDAEFHGHRLKGSAASDGDLCMVGRGVRKVAFERCGVCPVKNDHRLALRLHE